MVRYTAWTVVGLGLLALSISVALAGLVRLVETGTCASHPALVTSRPCPPGTGALIVVVGSAFFTGFLGWAAYQFRAPRHGPSPWRDGPDYGGFWWPALFLGGAWLFVDAARTFQAAGASGEAWAMGLVGAVFVAMGGVPLLVAGHRLPALVLGGPRPPSWWATAAGFAAVAASAAGAAGAAGSAGAAARRAAATAESATATDGAGRTASADGARPPADAARPPADTPPTDEAALVDALERLAALHRRGLLDDAEFATAKARVLSGDAPGVDP